MAKIQEKNDHVIVKSVTKDVKERVVVNIRIKALLKYIGFENYRLLMSNCSDIDSLFDDCLELTLTQEYIENTDHTKCKEPTKIERRPMGDELGVRKFVHATLLKKDVQYKAIEMIHMKEDTGEIHVKWLDRENRHREDRFKYQRKV